MSKNQAESQASPASKRKTPRRRRKSKKKAAVSTALNAAPTATQKDAVAQKNNAEHSAPTPASARLSDAGSMDVTQVDVTQLDVAVVRRVGESSPSPSPSPQSSETKSSGIEGAITGTPVKKKSSRRRRSKRASARSASNQTSSSTGVHHPVELNTGKQVAGGAGNAPSTFHSFSQHSKPSAVSQPLSVSATTRKSEKGGRVMLINVFGGDECRVAVVKDGQLEELLVERSSAQSYVGNIFKGRVTNVEPSIQAAFVDFGHAKNGFLHISDVQPQYFPDHQGSGEEVGRKVPRQQRPPIQKCFRRGQEVIVQVTKEGLGTKGPTLTTYISIPGRYLVMMPGMNRHGVSRKIEDEQTRRKMRDALDELDLPSGAGFILRTAGLDRAKRDLQRDLQYLTRLWKTVMRRIREVDAPELLYHESDLVIRAIRDLYTTEFDQLIVDDPGIAQKATEFLQIAIPRAKVQVELYSEREPLFHRYGVEEEIERINLRQVDLPSGGSLVIDTTEALVAIDVNSGKFRALNDAEETSYQINMEAAEEIARQLRLRDLGGLIVCDFIDMRLDRHKRAVERTLRDALRKHKERARILRMSAFGIIEMTRQRQGPSMKRNFYLDCPHCKGTGMVKMPESVMLDIIRTVQMLIHREAVRRITVTMAVDVSMQILNTKRALLNQMENETGKTVVFRGDPSFGSDQVDYACVDAMGRPLAKEL